MKLFNTAPKAEVLEPVEEIAPKLMSPLIDIGYGPMNIELAIMLRPICEYIIKLEERIEELETK